MPIFNNTIRQKNEILRKVERKTGKYHEEHVSKKETEDIEALLEKELNSGK